MHLVPATLPASLIALALAFVAISYGAKFLVDGSVGIAFRLRVPKIIIGIVLVGFATTAPELTVSLLAALRGLPELALGNAVGSVIVDDALALALGAIVAPLAIRVDSRVLKTTGLFLLAIAVTAFILAINGTVSRLEGLALVCCYIAYLSAVLVVERRRRRTATEPPDEELGEHVKPGGVPRQLLRLAGGVAVVIVSSEVLVESTTFVALRLGVPLEIIGLTIIAIGTSLPEIATNITASRRGHGDLALGNILGADILNILWIIGTAALANPIQVDQRVVLFSFPWMLLVVGTMLLLCRLRYRLTRWKGVVLVAIYAVYLTSTVLLFYRGGGG